MYKTFYSQYVRGFRYLVFFSIASGISLYFYYVVSGSARFSGVSGKEPSAHNWAIEKYYYEEYAPATIDVGDSSVKVAAGSREQCKIPQTPAVPQYFVDHWQPYDFSQDCKLEKNLFTLKDEQVMNLLPEAQEPCCIQHILRGRFDADSSVTSCTPVKRGQSIGLAEAFLVKCGSFIHADVSLEAREDVKKKMEFWDDIPEDKRPFSVFMFGFDSISRSHAFRSLPKSIDQMMKMGFVDFKAYHSVAASTLSNFMAFLMGLTRTEVRGSCAPNWTTPFDTCPIILKDFSSRNYITSYVEDGSQTFNWGGQSGFNEPPADYYFHHFFRELMNVRNEQRTWWSTLFIDPKTDCVSRESVPEFLLRYSSRFLNKFASYPLFSFLWFAEPFHEDILALPFVDTPLSELLKNLSANHNLLRNSLIIFLGDHGDRKNFFSSDSFESYFERGLPSLFVRIPDRLREEFPSAAAALYYNSNKFTTPFDIHETLLEMMEIPGRSYHNRSRTGRKVKIKDSFRSSLLHFFSPSRTCSNSNIAEANCLCNLKASNAREPLVGDNRLTQRMLESALKELNSKVVKSKYKYKCARWVAEWRGILYQRVVSETPGRLEYILAFEVSPGESQFEARIRVSRNGISAEPRRNIMKSIQVIGITRINKYGNQSWCVRTDTDEDKLLKEFCYCNDDDTGRE